MKQETIKRLIREAQGFCYADRPDFDVCDYVDGPEYAFAGGVDFGRASFARQLLTLEGIPFTISENPY